LFRISFYNSQLDFELREDPYDNSQQAWELPMNVPFPCTGN